jgi:hypothetical protein
MLKYGRFVFWIIAVVLVALLIISPFLENSDVQAQGDSTPTFEAFRTPILAVLSVDIDRTESRVQDIRRLRPTADLNREILSEDDLRHFVSRRLASEYTAEDVQSDLLFYAAFGFLDNNAELYSIIENLMLNQVADFYDRQADVMYMVETDSLDPFRSILYARQYTLALQNQNYNTQTIINDAINRQEYDQAMALMAVFEGDAQLTTMLFTEALIDENPEAAVGLITQSYTPQNTVLDEQAAIFKSELLFPSTNGLNFIQTLFNESNGWRLVNSVYERPPLSTEQILHPTLYLLYEVPHDVSVTPLNDFWVEQSPDDEWLLVRDQALGEFYLREHLRLFFEDIIADETAAGWGGDRFLLYHNETDSESVVVWKTSWDTPEDALMFDLQYGNFLGQWFGVSGEVTFDDGACWLAPGRNACKIALENNEILIVFAPNAELVKSIMEYELQETSTRILG